MHKKQRLWLAIAISSFSLPAGAVSLTAEIAPGYDNNPFRLADSFDPDSGWFADTNFKLEHKTDKVRLRAQLDNRAYEGDVDDADIFTGKLDARYKTRYKIGDKKTTSHVTVEYKNRDKTYVARSTGQVGTFSGEDIGDRYDYESWSLEAKTSVYFTRALNVGLQLDLLDKDYEDYDIAGLSNLDYDQIELTNDWSYRIDKQSKFLFELNFAKRDFDDKREKDLLGNTIAGTNLEYDYRGFAIGYERDITEHTEFEVEYAYEERRDSGDGYYDIDYSTLSAKLRYQPDDALRVTADISYRDREYINSDVFDENDEAEPSTDGYTFRLDMDKKLAFAKDFPTSLIAGFRYDDYDSNDSAYEYDRSQLYAGVKVKFGK